MGKVILRGFIIVLVGLAVLVAAWTWVTLNWTYSEGERAGYIQKFSHKGWLCKTWEGEVAMVTMPGAIPEKFEFTVRDDTVAARINALAGNRMVLHYEQHKFVPSSCFAETEYFVVDVQPVADNLVTPQQGPKSLAPELPAPVAPQLPAPALPQQPGLVVPGQPMPQPYGPATTQ